MEPARVAIDFQPHHLRHRQRHAQRERETPIKAVGNDFARGSIRLIAKQDARQGASRRRHFAPTTLRSFYFDGQNPREWRHDRTASRSARPKSPRAISSRSSGSPRAFVEGQQSVVFGFTSNVEPVRAPVRLKDLSRPRSIRAPKPRNGVCS